MAVNFNGIVATFTGPESGATASTMAVTSHSESGNSRPDIDITDAGDTTRKVIPGLAEAEKHTFEVVMGSGTPAQFKGFLTDCDSGQLIVAYTPCGSETTTNLVSIDAWVTAFTLTGELDGAYTASIEFTKDNTGS